MLDQNTDRMWYVIGAVLVGAAIILIANGTLPQMFASVTGGFDGAIDEISYHMAIGQYGEVDNLFTFNESTFEYDMMPNRTNGLRNPNPIANNWYSTSHLIPVKAGAKYRFTAPDKVCSPIILYYGVDGEYLGNDYKKW